MKKFIGKMLLACLLIAATFIVIGVCLFASGGQYRQGYCASLRDKVNRLESVSEPKIILVGDSNLAFGIRSEIIEREVGMPVVNLGLHGGLGNEFNESIAKFGISEGDIVVLCNTSYSDEGVILDYENAWTTVEWDKELWKLIPKDEHWNMIKIFPTYVYDCVKAIYTGKANRAQDTAYSRSSFNEYGDNIYADNHEQHFTFDFKTDEPKLNDNCVARVNGFGEYVEGKGASLVVAGWPIADGEYGWEAAVFESYQQELDEKLEPEIISDFTDYMFDYSYFWDTQYHLTGEGAILRTEQLVKDLKKYINGK